MHSLIVEHVEAQKEENSNYMLSFDPVITTVNSNISQNSGKHFFL